MRQRAFDVAGTRMLVVVLDSGEDPIAILARVAGDEGLDASHFTAIGAFENATVAWFDPDARTYRPIEVGEQVEVLSLVGDITLKAPEGREPQVHAHAVLGRRDGSAMGGHLLRASVRPTLEIVVTEAPAQLRRRHDDASGLALIDLDLASGDPTPG
jgi:predicted DNA-binding protein with PD1-like motif